MKIPEQMDEQTKGYWEWHSWPGPDEWYAGPLEVFETGQEGLKTSQAATKSTNKKKKT